LNTADYYRSPNPKPNHSPNLPLTLILALIQILSRTVYLRTAVFRRTDVPTRDENNLRSEETQTLRAGCSKAEPKNFAPPQTPFLGRGTAKI